MATVMRLSFSVTGVPPKKDGASSMWNKGQMARLKALRTRLTRRIRSA